MTQPNTYLSKRPFLVIDMLHRPARGVRTENRGWTKEPRNWDITEVSRMVDRITPNLMRNATVIIDVMPNTLVKSRFTGDESEAVLKHFARKYAAMIAQANDVWTARQSSAQTIDA